MKILLIFIGVCIISGLVFLLYFASQFSAVYPPIKTYTYKTSASQLEHYITKVVDIDSNLSFRITDITGTEYPYRYYAELLVKEKKHNYKFNFSYENTNNFWNHNEHLNLNLLGAFDQTNKTGGYLIEEKGVGILIPVFERYFIKKLVIK